jgi:hypothetical protein
MILVVSQPMYFPWVGLLEQIRLSDQFVHYDDVQYTRGFYNRVQVKVPGAIRWMTVPLRGLHRGQCLNEIVLDESKKWREEHRRLLAFAHAEAPFRNDVLDLVDSVFASRCENLADIARASTMALAKYFGLDDGRSFVDSSSIGIAGHGSQRLLDICSHFGADCYVTGHGARNYLDHDLFERHGVRVEYMDYRCETYPQAHGPFTPYVSSLDLIANCGRSGVERICSGSRPWREFLNEST